MRQHFQEELLDRTQMTRMEWISMILNAGFAVLSDPIDTF